MTAELAQKVAIVTGGASGLGRAAVERLVEEGARVVVADLDRELGEALARELGDAAAFRAVDVSDVEQVRELVDFAVQRFGGLHVMLNNAGVSGPLYPDFLDDDLSHFHRVLGVNLLGVMAGTRFAAKHMVEHGGGSIINVTSIGGIQAGRGAMVYGSSKAAVIHFSNSAAIALGEHGVRVNCLAPGSIPTPLLMAAAAHMSPGEQDAYVAMVRDIQAEMRPLNRAGVPEDVAEAVLFLAGERSAYITGALLRVDGGTAAGNTRNPSRRPAVAPTTR